MLSTIVYKGKTTTNEINDKKTQTNMHKQVDSV